MKPDFALSLSMEGISFLCRAEAGWHVIGDVALDHPNLGAALADLRVAGEALVSGPASCKLVLPADQIKYLQIEATEEDAETQVAAALEGATPYPVSDLAYDFTEFGDEFLIAAVAVETLREAESFAVEHGFAPVCFVAIPDDGEFDGEPFFGSTQMAGDYITANEYPEPDQDEVYITGHGAPIEFSPLFSEALAPKETPAFASSRQPDASPTPDPDLQPDPDFEAYVPSHDPVEPETYPEVEVVTEPEANFAPAPDPALEFGPEPEPEETRVAPVPAPASALSDQSPRFDPTLVAAGLKHRPHAGTKPKTKKIAPTPPLKPKKQPRPGTSLLQTQLGITSRPKTFALFLITICVVILACIVTWAALFTQEGVTGLMFRSSATQVAALPAQSSPTDEEGIETQALLPLSPDSITDSAEIEAMEEGGLFDPTGLKTDNLREAEARYAATGIWDLAPGQPVAPPSETAENIYLGSFEISQQTHDAIALPEVESFAADIAVAQQFDPHPFGTSFTFDERGLVVASADGSLTPEWIMVFTGKPAVTPAAWPSREESTEDAPATEAETAAATQLASLRPQVRPSDLIQQNERATLGGSTRSELAGIRPKLRPDDQAMAAAASVIAAVDPADLEGATEQAVLASLRPAARPADFAKTVEKIKAQTASVAVPPAAAITPSIPSSASVARSATQTNAIKLREINLIGVYGTASERRALVRLASGRYKKVKVGDRLDGGRVSAIGNNELRYVKGSRNIVLALPKG